MTILNVGDNIRCISHYSTSTTIGNVYEIEEVKTHSAGFAMYFYVDDDADYYNMDSISDTDVLNYFEVVGVDKSEQVIAVLTARVAELESILTRIKEAVAND